MYYAKAMLRDTLKVVQIANIDYVRKTVRYVDDMKYFSTTFDNVVWLECNSRPIIK